MQNLRSCNIVFGRQSISNYSKIDYVLNFTSTCGLQINLADRLRNFKTCFELFDDLQFSNPLQNKDSIQTSVLKQNNELDSDDFKHARNNYKS